MKKLLFEINFIFLERNEANFLENFTSINITPNGIETGFILPVIFKFVLNQSKQLGNICI